jgi:hypothetical protein
LTTGNADSNDMGADFADTSSRSSSDDDDDPEAALNPGGDDSGNVAPLFRLRRLPPHGSQDAGATLLPGEGGVMSVYMMMHRYERNCSCTTLGVG